MTGPTPDSEQTLEFRLPPTNRTARRVTVLAGIAAAAVIAVLVIVTLAFRGDTNVLTPDQVAQQLADGPSAGTSGLPDPSASPDDSATPDPSAFPDASAPAGGGGPAVIDTVAATLTLTCDGTRVAHATWSIKPGYRLDEQHQTATSVSLKIESDIHDDVIVKAYCPAGPQVLVTTEPDDHGGGGNGGGPGHG